MPWKAETENNIVVIGTGELTIEQVVGVARYGWVVAEISPGVDSEPARETHEKMMRSRRWVESAVEKNQKLLENGAEPLPYYGINTGFGSKASRYGLPDQDIPWVSRNLVVSHSVGVGENFHPEIVRAAILVRANSLALGYSGVRVELVNTLVRMLNRGLVPMIPQHGSLGASGDLIPLAHLAAILSERPPDDQPLSDFPEDYQESGYAYLDLRFFDQQHPFKRIIQLDGIDYALLVGKQAMRACGIDPLVLRAKEALALNNGTAFSAAISAIALYDAENVTRHAEIGAALSLEAILGFRDAFFPHVQRVRRHMGQIQVAERILKITRGSCLLDGDQGVDPRCSPPQDPYSIRVSPQVIGAVWDVLGFIRKTITDEINAVTDNPLIFDFPKNHPDFLPRPYKAVSGGNFHGAPLAYAMDFLSTVITDLGSLSERRIFRLTDEKLNYGLPSYLVSDVLAKPGLTSGLMLVQYLAAGLVSDCKTLAHPDSVDSIPTSANQEDHVSMSMNAARHARTVVDNIQYVVAIELLCGYLGLKWRIELLQQMTGGQRDKPEEWSRERQLIEYLSNACANNDNTLVPRPGVGSQRALDVIHETLFPAGEELPSLGTEPTSRDRYLQPYVLRLTNLLKKGILVNQVYSASGIALPVRAQHISKES